MFYLCGGMGLYGKEHFEEANIWRVNIKNQIEEISAGKVKCCNPNDHFNFLSNKDYKTQREIMNYDLFKVRNSDLVIVNFNDPKWQLHLNIKYLLLDCVKMVKKTIYILG